MKIPKYIDTERDRLIELLDKKQHQGNATETGVNYIQNSELADYLISNGVIVPPCKVGTYVYFITDVNGDCFTIRFGRVYEISITSNDNLFLSIAEYDESDNVIDYWGIPKCQWGKTIFLTKEEAESKLKEINNER